MRSISIILVALAVAAYTQPVELIHSNVMESFSGGEVVILKGSVRLKHIGRELYADFARWDRRSGVVRFEGGVVIADTGYTIRAEELRYMRRSQIAEAYNDVKFTNADSTITAYGEKGFYDGVREFVSLTQNTHLTRIDSTGSRLELDAFKLNHYIGFNYSVAVGSVEAALYPEDTMSSPLLLLCDSLEFYQDSDFVAAFGNVNIIQDSIYASAPIVYMWRKSGRIMLIEGAEVKESDWTLWADTMYAIIIDNKIASVEATTNPRGLWHDPADTLNLTQDSRLSADRMFFDFDNGKIAAAHLVQRATVDYFPAPSDTQFMERHLISGDSLVAFLDSAKIDSIEVYGGVQGVSYRISDMKRDSISYSGELMALSQQKRVHIYEEGYVQYGSMRLWAGQVHFDGDTRLLTAKPLQLGDSLVGEPFMRETKDSLRSRELTYNIETKRGKLSYGRTAADKGFFTGKETAKAQGDTFYISKATFTTCDRIPPHYHFYAPRLKLIPRDKAIVRPVWLYIDRLPFFWLPYFVFSVKKGRHSGILTMDIGKFQEGQRFVRNLGYYLTINDYLDVYGALDIDEEQGVYIKGEISYALRYHFSGKLFGSYKMANERDWDSGFSTAKRWEIRGSHNQTIGERSKLSASVSMVSDASYLTETHDVPEERMDRRLRSYGSFSQGFEWGSFSASVDRTENLDDNTKTLYLPKLSLRKYSGTVLGDGEKWFNKFYYSANSNMVGYSYTDESDETERHYGLDASGGLTFAHSFGDYMTISPSLSMSGAAIDRGTENEILPIIAAYSLSTQASTELYGNIPIGIIGLKYFHHIVSPTVAFSYSPEVEGRDRFYSIPGIRIPSGQKSANIQFTLGQQFGLKLVDSLQTTRKVALFSTSSGISYNFVAEGRKFSDITTSLRTQPINWLSITASLIHTLYSGSNTEPSGIYALSAKLNSSARFEWEIPFPIQPRAAAMSISHYFSKNIQTEAISHWIKTGANVFPTPNWKVAYDIYYDIEQGMKVSDEFRIWRDLHCWEIGFVWVPEGVRAGYYFRINVKELPEIKIERTEGSVRWR